MLKCFLVGKDARTTCLADTLARSRHALEIYSYSEFRIPGLLERSKELVVGDFSKSVKGVIEYARNLSPDFVVIGPEEPLAIGIVDGLTEIGIPSFGPCRDLARLETSKSFTRELLSEFDIQGNPEYRVFRESKGLETFLKGLGRFVVKPDGLTGGKGVKLYPYHFTTFEEAQGYAMGCLKDAGVVVVEELLEGEEFSLQTICDGQHFAHFPVVQDHKRAFEGDVGPNTGGMGSYSCENFKLPFLSTEQIDQAKNINVKVGRALLEKTGKPYKGVLYGGFMATPQGVRLVEYNARFADPECMNVLPILKTDFVDICSAVIDGRLKEQPLSFENKATVCKYIVPASYPRKKLDASDELVIPPHVASMDGIRLYHAAVNQNKAGDKCLLTGSRALAIVGIGSCLNEAEQLAEKAASNIRGDVRYRKDIGTAELVGRRVEHMRQLMTTAPTRAANRDLGISKAPMNNSVQ